MKSELVSRAVGDETKNLHRPVCVEVYVADHCHVCDYTHEVVEMIRREFPAVSVEIVNLNDTSRKIPAAVFATPTYLLNGRVWSLGNPSQQEVRSHLTAALAQSGVP